MKMIDVSDKEVTKREAVVEGIVRLSPKVIALIKSKKIPKGDCLEAARLAGIMAAKRTPEVIPLCHPIPIESAEIEFSLKRNEIRVLAVIKGRAKTGEEMEALTAVSVAALTIYDMCKMFDKGIEITDIRLLKKTGGKSGTYLRNSKLKSQKSK